MKIVILNGSPRKNGSTATLLKEMAKILRSKGDAEICYIDLADYELKNCIGCMSCYHKGICCLDDKVEEINTQIAQSNGLIIGSPTYSSSMSGTLKIFVDRGHFVLEQALKGKYTFALNTYEIAGGGSVISALKTLFLYSGGIPAGEYSCKLPFNTSPFDRSGARGKLAVKTDKFYRKIKSEKPKALTNRLIHHIALHIIMKPQVLKRPTQYKAVIDRWKKIAVIK
ncbi:MAG: flavodoxin family protein [Culturomica sp.]|jgi:multimeric flavodoxin WrbA|nr:flavodoxin family protein [Culturomica sp.]